MVTESEALDARQTMDWWENLMSYYFFLIVLAIYLFSFPDAMWYRISYCITGG